MEHLLQKIKDRASNPDTIHDMVQGLSPKPAINPVISIEKIRETENELGFKFPELYVKIYTEIGNGGFGPGYGLYDIEVAKRIYLEWMSDPENEWEKGTFPLCTWGCDIDSYVDCEDKGFPVYYTADDEDHETESEISFSIADPNGNIIQTGKGKNVEDILNNIDNGPVDRGHAPPKQEEEDEDEDYGLLYHKDTIEEWLTDWVEGVDIWTDMMGEEEDE